MTEEEIIIDGIDVSGCEYMLNNKIKGKQHCPAKAMPYAKETSCICRKSIDTPYNFCKHNSNCHYKQFKRLEQELKWANDEEKYLKECCIKAGKELEKHSFKWDGKEKNLVIQALQLNQLYEKLEQENKTLNYQWHKQSEIGDEWYKVAEKYRSVLAEIHLILDELKQQYDYMTDYSEIKEIQDKINEVLNEQISNL